MRLSDSDLTVIFLLGKKGKLSGSRIYNEAKKEAECTGRRPEHKASIFRSIRKLMKQGYLEEVGERRVRGTLERFYSLTDLGQSEYVRVHENILVWENIPDFRYECSICEHSDVEDCWKYTQEILEAVVKRAVGKPHVSFELSLLKRHFKNPGALREFIFWLNMLIAPRNMLMEKFKPQIQGLRLDHLLEGSQPTRE